MQWMLLLWLRREIILGFGLGLLAVQFWTSLPSVSWWSNLDEELDAMPLPSVSPLLLQQLREGGGKQQWRGIERLLVVPGGGPGNPGTDGGFPLWTRQRTDAALEEWRESCEPFGSARCAILALSAGSMNAPSPRNFKGHVVFESSLIAEHLVRNGVPPEAIICDWATWDTVGNAWFTRLVAEALIHLADPDRLKKIQGISTRDGTKVARGSTLPETASLFNGHGVVLRLTVFISDFHAARMHAALDWVFGLDPRPGDQYGVRTTVDVVSVISKGTEWEERESFKDRMKHESQWETRLRGWASQGLLQSATEMQAYLLLGAHSGYFQFTHGTYITSSGGGWGKL